MAANRGQRKMILDIKELGMSDSSKKPTGEIHCRIMTRFRQSNDHETSSK
jgi:hypothetical protein